MTHEFRSHLVDVAVELKHETELAVKVRLDEDSPWVWLPKSRIEIERHGGATVTVTLPEALAIEKRLA